MPYASGTNRSAYENSRYKVARQSDESVYLSGTAVFMHIHLGFREHVPHYVEMLLPVRPGDEIVRSNIRFKP